MRVTEYARIAQLAEALVLGTKCCRFNSDSEHQIWAVSSAAEQRLYTANVGGSIPSRPTNLETNAIRICVFIANGLKVTMGSMLGTFTNYGSVTGIGYQS